MTTGRINQIAFVVWTLSLRHIALGDGRSNALWRADPVTPSRFLFSSDRRRGRGRESPHSPRRRRRTPGTDSSMARRRQLEGGRLAGWLTPGRAGPLVSDCGPTARQKASGTGTRQAVEGPYCSGQCFHAPHRGVKRRATEHVVTGRAALTRQRRDGRGDSRRADAEASHSDARPRRARRHTNRLSRGEGTDDATTQLAMGEHGVDLKGHLQATSNQN